jgi:hypothetical protein
MNYYIGMDVGASGGYGIITDNEGTPNLIKYGKFHASHEKTISTLIKVIYELEMTFKDTLYIFYEDVHSIFNSSAKSNFIFGFNKGILAGMSQTLIQILPVLNVVVLPVHAKVWQNKVWISQDREYDTSGMTRKNATKRTSLNAANRLFPNESYRPTSRSTVPHDGVVDGVLLSYYGYKLTTK